ncbi:MAG: SUMF1/EgtB/PvdO family nonheme iron enzyme [Candidatus Ratteibacteria bacterium]|jgi:formylglycine-generating enzyme required for sulfatase activity
MSKILISEEDGTKVAKTNQSSEKQKTPLRAIISSFLLIILALSLILGIIIIAKNIAKKTMRLGHNSVRSNELAENGLSVPQPTPGLALPGISGGGSASSSNAPKNPEQAPSPEGMVLVPAGDYIAGWNENGTSVKLNVPAFFMDKYEISNRQYADFVRATEHKPPADPRGPKYNIWKNGIYPNELANHPVVNVSYQDAKEFAEWVGKRLPTKEEWERASRGNEGFIYPWGNNYIQTYANGNRQGKGTTTPVGSFPYDRSPFGIFDMVGNVREWTTTPYTSDSKRWKIVKGGSFEDGANELSSYAQFKGTMPEPNLGFRCVKDAR